MFKTTAPAFAAGAIFTVLVAGGGAVAATGGNLILGKDNSASRTTGLAAKKGPALKLTAKGPALRVPNTSRIDRLNADLLDGHSASSFASANARTGSYDASGFTVDLDSDGLTDTLAAIATCPSGSQMTGGGGANLSNTGVSLFSSPIQAKNGEGWLYAVAVSESASEAGDNVHASVVCWSASGSGLPGAYRPSTTPSKNLRQVAMDKLRAAPTR